MPVNNTNPHRAPTAPVKIIIIMCIGVVGIVAVGIAIDAFAQEGVVIDQKSNISVTTDKTEYVSGDVIIISGNITTSLSDTPVILQIFIEGNPAYINQITPALDNTYWDIVKAEGTKWTHKGEYEVNIRYGKDGKATAKFNFTPEDDAERPDPPPPSTGEVQEGIMEVESGNETFDVQYSILGGNLVDVTFDWRDFTLIVDIETTSNVGSVTLDIPREYIGAEKSIGSAVADDTFIIQIDGVQADYEEGTSGPATRKITIDFVEGDSEIRIIGTYAVPEFSHYVMMMMAIAGIMTTLIILSKTRYAKVAYIYNKSSSGNNIRTECQ